MKTAKPFLSFVIPVHNEESNLAWHYAEIKKHFDSKPLTYELLYVDDGSKDNSLQILKDFAKRDPRVHYLSFSRNFGKEAATTAGINNAKGDAVIIIDGDGQHPLATIDTFIEEWQKGFEVVIGVRTTNQGESFVARTGSQMFYKMLRLLDSSQEIVSKSTDFRLLDRKVVDEYNKLTERNRIARNLVDWLGFKRTYVNFRALERHGGAPSYSFSKRLKLAMDGLVKHSTKPLKFIGGLGMLISTVAAIAFIVIIIEKYALNDPLKLYVSGTAILGLFLSFMSGIILVCQGLLALYIEDVFHEAQNRPLYIISEEA